MAKQSAITVELLGWKQAIAGLNDFGQNVRYRVTRDAVSKGAGFLRDAAKRNAPHETKLLKNNLIVRTFVPKNDSGVYCKIGARKKVKKPVSVTAKGLTKQLTGKKLAAAAAAGTKMVYRSPSRVIHLVEHGTKQHTVAAKNKKVLARAGTIIGTSAQIKAKANPFMSRTARSEGPAATAATMDKLQKGIDFERRKCAAKSMARAVKKAS